MASSYDWGTLYSGKFAGQYHLADATGDAVVIGFGSDGELAFTRKAKGDGHLVSTNFNRAFPENRYVPYPCPRFARASEMLERINKERSRHRSISPPFWMQFMKRGGASIPSIRTFMI